MCFGFLMEKSILYMVELYGSFHEIVSLDPLVGNGACNVVQ